MLCRRLLFTLELVLIVGTLFVFPIGLFAAEDTCECYCNIEGSGATKVSDESTTADRCQELCREGGFSVAVCAMTPSQKPQYNVLCFTPEECTDQGGIRTATGTGDPIQPGECKQGMYYCYPDPTTRKKATLGVSFPGLTETGDLGEYISVVYKWMLGAGTTIAIVFMMVAGLRWALGGASAEQIGKAKKTITSAMVGLVLLLSTYVIIFTVNPYLVRLQVPAFPMIKSISLVGEGSCGYLTGWWGDGSHGHYPFLIENGAPYDSPYAEGGDPGNGYTVENGAEGENCGAIANVTKDPDGNTVADDMTCTYDYCPDLEDRCLPISGGGFCLSCLDFAYGGEAPLEPTSAICSAYNKTIIENGKVTSVEKCTFYNSSMMTDELLQSVLGIDIDAYLGTPFCYYQSESCSGRTCASYHAQSDCETKASLCSLSCQWEVTSTSTNVRGAEEFEIGTCSDK